MLGSSIVSQAIHTQAAAHTISVVIPVYQGEKTLAGVIREIADFTRLSTTPDGHTFRVTEALLVFDHGPDQSAMVIRQLATKFDFLRPVWLSRNNGQHAATLAGMASAGGDWVVTLDEDGQHDPADIASMLDTAMRDGASIVYIRPTNHASHGALRNAASKASKWGLTKVFSGSNAQDFQSYRLMLGSTARSVAAYAGSGVYLDVAIGWVAGRASTTPVVLRDEGDRQSGYSTRRLFSHYWRMILSSGTRGLRLVSVLGVLFAVLGVGLALVVLISRLSGTVDAEGWASTVVIQLLGTGAILFSLGVIAEYLGVSVNMAMGKPPYVITSDPADGPLGRTLTDAR